MASTSSIARRATRPAQAEANVKAAGWNLTPDELTEVDKITKDDPGAGVGR
jgi:aryl-alcohol dehydrogenase-like predicted oxidoreductase